MNLRVLGVYREAEFSPGKVAADRAIMDAVLKELRALGADTDTIPAETFVAEPPSGFDLLLAMCQGSRALSRLAAASERGALVVNSALSIRNCYRDLLGPGLTNARIPTPAGAVLETAEPFDLKPLRTLGRPSPLYIKRGDLHALGSDDVRRVDNPEQVEPVLRDFASRGIERAYVQQEAAGEVVKFYGVGSAADYFTAIGADGHRPAERVRGELGRAAAAAATALGLEVWGGDAAIGPDGFAIIDFNDWPSFAVVRDEAAIAIARHCLTLIRRHSVTAHGPTRRGSSFAD
jgi:glutathione synthase/RimK-type ligase-like ATP-grasp enzyme